MLHVRLTDSGILVVQPSGPITSDDFSAIQVQVDPWLEAGGKLKGMLIDAPEFPGWKDFAGFRSHLRFVMDHHREIPRVAVVSNDEFLSALPKLARHFVKADFRRYDAGETAEAISWLESPHEPQRPSLRHSWFPAEHLVWVTIDGKVTTEECNDLLRHIEAILAKHSPISFLVNFEDLEGVELGALIKDTKVGFTHLKSVKRLALVGESHWIKRITSFPNPFSLEIKSFDEDQEHQAWEWITGKATH